MIYKMTLKDSADEMTFDLLEVPIVDKDIEGAVDNVTLDGNQYTDYLYLKKQFIQKWSLLCDDEYTRLRGFYTRQFENADVPSYRLYYGDDIVRNSTLSGEYITFSVEGVADGTMSLMQIDGNTTQDGTPAPSTPVPIETVTGRQTVGIVSKNLYDPTATPWGSKVAYNSSGTQVWWSGYYGIIEYQPVQPNTQYTFSNSAGKPILYGLVFYDANKTMLSTVPSATTTFTTPANCAYIRFAIQNDSAPTWTQLELGNQATAYEPYKAQDYEINLGKNLFDKNATLSNDRRISTSNGNTYTATGYTTSDYTEVKPSTVYTLTSGITSYFAWYKADKTYISGGSWNNQAQQTAPSNAQYVRFDFQTSNIDAVQLEKGSQATDYSAYFTPIELCKIGTYQDRIYKENGKWWLHKEIGRFDITGTESWSRSGRTTSTVFAGVLNGAALTNHIQIGADGGLSNRFTYQKNTTVDGAIDTYNWSGGIATTLLFCLSTERASDVTSFKTWLTNNPTTYYYVLATPTTTEITNEEVLEGLEALLNEVISVGQHNIYTDTPNALPTLTFDLTEYLSKSTTIIPETAVRLTLTDGGVINACGCRKDVQLTMRETIE